MSGTAALAAARRRRAGPANDSRPNTSPQQYNPSVNSISSSNSAMNQPVRTINPGELLLQHNKLIGEMNEEIKSLKNSPKPSASDPTQLEYFKNQYLALSEEVKEMKKVLIKIQTFSMETNLELLKMKRILKQEIPDNEEVKEELKNTLIE